MILAINFNQLFYNIENHVYTDKEIKSYIYALIKYLGLNDFFRGVIMNSPRIKGLATYSFKTLKIKIAKEYIERDAVLEYEHTDLNKSIIAFINLSILQAIYHEVVHVVHNNIAFTSEYSIGYLFLIDILALNNLELSDDEYDIIHDFMIIERDANITSLENILIIIKRYLNNDKLFDYFLDKLRYFMLDGFEIKKEIISPMERLYANVYHLELPSVSNLDLYDRIKLGLPLKKNDIRTYKNNEINIILSKNNLH